jgi:UDP-N-acetyl-D-mannosaminuronic acid dehydrogenase
MKKKINVIGLGYIGLPTAALLSSKGYSVSGTDTNSYIVNTINKGKTHINEIGLNKLVKNAVKKGKLKAFNEVKPSDVFIICVPTPFNKSKKIPTPNLEYILQASRNIAPVLKPGNYVILESTSPVGTTKKVRNILADNGVLVEKIHIAYCPERVLPGKILNELIENDRIVGGLTPLTTKKISNFYRTFVSGKVHETDTQTAEMCKLVENSFRDVNIAFANELSVICDQEGINVRNVISLSNHHPRINILEPSTGVGGHCIAVDPWFIVSRDPINSRLIRTAREVNNDKVKWVINKIKLAAAKKNKKKDKRTKIVCLGLTYKSDIDDLRNSPALEVAEKLNKLKFDVVSVEPNISKHPFLRILDFNTAINDADIVAILVKHKEFKSPRLQKKLYDLGALDFCNSLINS